MNEIVLNLNVTGGNQLAVSKVCIGGIELVMTISIGRESADAPISVWCHST